MEGQGLAETRKVLSLSKQDHGVLIPGSSPFDNTPSPVALGFLVASSPPVGSPPPGGGVVVREARRR